MTIAVKSLSFPEISRGYNAMAFASMASGISVGEIERGGRFPHLARLRWAVMYVLNRKCGWSSPRIGKFFNKEHSTIIHGVRKCEALMATDEEFSTFVAEMAAAVGRE